MDGVVYDLTDYLERHPGGADILRMYLGRDATRAFHAIPGHASKAVAKQMEQYALGRFDPVPAVPTFSPVVRALDYIVMIDNSFRTQLAHSFGTPRANLMFCGQFLAHVLGEHILQTHKILSPVIGKTEDDSESPIVIHETGKVCATLRVKITTMVEEAMRVEDNDIQIIAILDEVGRFHHAIVDKYVAELREIIEFIYQSSHRAEPGELSERVEGALQRVLSLLLRLV